MGSLLFKFFLSVVFTIFNMIRVVSKYIYVAVRTRTSRRVYGSNSIASISRYTVYYGVEL